MNVRKEATIEPNQNQEELTLSKLQSLYNLLHHPRSSSSSSRSGGLSPSQPTNFNNNNNNQLGGRHVKVPLTSKAFFEGTLQPRIIVKSNNNSEGDDYVGGNGNSDGNGGVCGDERCEEQVVMNLGKRYLAEMSRSEACDYLQKRMKPLLQLQEQQQHQPLKSALRCDGIETKKNYADNNHATNDDKKAERSKLQLKKGFLNNNKKKKGNSRSSTGIRKKVEEKKDLSTSILPSPSSESCSNKVSEEANVPKKIVEESIANTMSTITHIAAKNDANAGFKSNSSIPMPMLPFVEIREEYDKDGNEIKAEALNVSEELLNFQRDLKSKKETMENSTTTATAKNNIVDTLLENLPDDLNVVHSNDVSDNNAISENHVNDENDAITATPNEMGSRKERHLKETTASSPIYTSARNTIDSSSSDYDEITSRLDRLILLEEQHEIKKQENRKSSKRLRGKGWAKGFFLDDKDKASSTSFNNSSGDRNTEGAPTKSTYKNIKKYEEDGGRKNDNDFGGKSQRPKERVVKFQPSDEVKEIPRIGTRSISNPHSNVIQNMMESAQVSQGNMNNITTATRNKTNYTSKRESVSIGGVIERNHIERNKNNNDDDRGIGGDNANNMGTQQATRRGQILQNNVNAEDPKAATIQAPKKKLSRFAQRRQQLRQV